MNRTLANVIAVLAAAACSQAATDDSDAQNAQVQLAPQSSSGGGTPRLHPTEAACITYEMTGQMQSGTTTRCHRNWAYEQYEIQDITIGMAGFSQSQSAHIITIGDTIYNIDVAAGTGTQTTNPMYDSLVNNMSGASAEDLSAQFMAAMGMSPTGETKAIADTPCDMYASQGLGTVCMTDGGLMLEQSVMGMGQVATSVSIGDGGADENYTLYQNVTLTEGPDLSNGLQGLLGQ